MHSYTGLGAEKQNNERLQQEEITGMRNKTTDPLSGRVSPCWLCVLSHSTNRVSKTSNPNPPTGRRWQSAGLLLPSNKQSTGLQVNKFTQIFLIVLQVQSVWKYTQCQSAHTFRGTLLWMKTSGDGLKPLMLLLYHKGGRTSVCICSYCFRSHSLHLALVCAWQTCSN